MTGEAGDPHPFEPSSTSPDPGAGGAEAASEKPASADTGSPAPMDEPASRVARALALGVALGIFLLRSGRRGRRV